MFQKTGAPEKGVRISEEGEWEEQVPYEDDGFVTPPAEEEEDELDAAGEK